MGYNLLTKSYFGMFAHIGGGVVFQRDAQKTFKHNGNILTDAAAANCYTKTFIYNELDIISNKWIMQKLRHAYDLGKCMKEKLVLFNGNDSLNGIFKF